MIAHSKTARPSGKAYDPHFTVDLSHLFGIEFDGAAPGAMFLPTRRPPAPAPNRRISDDLRPEKLITLANRIGIAQGKLRIMAERMPPAMAKEVLRAADHLDKADEILNRVEINAAPHSRFIGSTVNEALHAV